MRKLFLKDKGGQAIIEFAVLLPILLLVLFGITEFGRAIMVTNVLNTAAREGARKAISPYPEGSDSLSVQSIVKEVLDAANIAAKEITIQNIDIDGTTYVEVLVKTDFEVLSGGILDPFVGTFELKGKTIMRKM
jgi:Flp pilus assembly protein TadG